MSVAFAILDNQFKASYDIGAEKKRNFRAVTVGARCNFTLGLVMCWPGRQAELHHPPCLLSSLPARKKKDSVFGPGYWFLGAMADREGAAPDPVAGSS